MSIPQLYTSTHNPPFTKTFLPSNAPNHYSIVPSKQATRKIRCTQSYLSNCRNEDHSSQPPKITITNNIDANIIKLDRRDLLIGLGSVCGATMIQSPNLDLAFATPTKDDMLPKKLDSTIRTQVARARKSRSQKQKEEEEEVLNVNMELLQLDKYIKFDVFINEEDDNPPKMRVMNSEYAGSFVRVPHGSHKANQKTSLTLGLTDLIQDLGVDDDDSLEVILVPRSGSGSVLITDVKIDYIS